MQLLRHFVAHYDQRNEDEIKTVPFAWWQARYRPKMGNPAEMAAFVARDEDTHGIRCPADQDFFIGTTRRSRRQALSEV